MPGLDLEEVIRLLRSADRANALASLCQRVLPGQTGPLDVVSAVVWATPSIAHTTARVVAPFVPLERDRILGADVAQLRFGHVALLVEQPEKDASVAAFVRRFGEGVAGVYLERPRYMPRRSFGGRPSKPTPTPLGRRGWLLPHEWPWGPFVIALERAQSGQDSSPRL